MIGVTKRQSQVLAFIRRFISENGYSPSFEEIGIAMNLSSLSTIARHIKNLKCRGYIDYTPNRSRSIRPLNTEV